MALTTALIIQNLHTLSGFEGQADDDTPLFSSGALDSIAMINLITFIEQQAGIEIRADEVTLENFDTPARISRFALERAA
ncbi:MAG: acyl carrier protein [Sphingobium sp.]|nr:acyl carrier protein [Sphingobium sp.]